MSDSQTPAFRPSEIQHLLDLEIATNFIDDQVYGNVDYSSVESSLSTIFHVGSSMISDFSDATTLPLDEPQQALKSPADPCQGRSCNQCRFSVYCYRTHHSLKKPSLSLFRPVQSMGCFSPVVLKRHKPSCSDRLLTTGSHFEPMSLYHKHKQIATGMLRSSRQPWWTLANAMTLPIPHLSRNDGLISRGASPCTLLRIWIWRVRNSWTLLNIFTVMVRAAYVSMTRPN
jgi:hypothetical protein